MIENCCETILGQVENIKPDVEEQEWEDLFRLKKVKN